MSDSCNPESTTGMALRRKIKKGAKYNREFVQVASRMVAAGMTEKELGFFLGVKPATIKKWKQRYDEFALATKNGSSAKEIAKSHLVANGLRAAMGYDYEEVDRVMERNSEGELIVKKETRKLKHKPIDKDMLIFFLINMDRGEGNWKNVKSVEIEQKKQNVNINLTGEIEASTIKALAGAAIKEADKMEKETKVVRSVVID